jgi:hypothetical protein
VFRCDEVALQGLVDTDQTIFDGIDDDSLTETANGSSAIIALNSSYRFPATLAVKMLVLSGAALGPFQAFRDAADVMPHTISLYVDAAKPEEAEKQSQLMHSIDPVGVMSSVKAVVAQEGEGGHSNAYCSHCDRSKVIKLPR